MTVAKTKVRGKHRRRRERAPLPGMLLHQDGSRHEWVPGKWWDLIVTMDDATGEHYSMFFCQEEGTESSFHGVGQTIARQGLFRSLYTDRGSHYFHTPEAGGAVDRSHPNQFGRALARLGISHIAPYSPQARGRSERTFGTHQLRLPRELAKAGVMTLEQANRYPDQFYLPQHNAEFCVPAQEEGSAFIAFLNGSLPDILCQQHERVVGNDNRVQFERLRLQIPADPGRHPYVKQRVRVHRYVDHSLALFHGPRLLPRFDPDGQIRSTAQPLAA